jgi:hypothetical protein
LIAADTSAAAVLAERCLGQRIWRGFSAEVLSVSTNGTET